VAQARSRIEAVGASSLHQLVRALWGRGGVQRQQCVPHVWLAARYDGLGDW